MPSSSRKTSSKSVNAAASRKTSSKSVNAAASRKTSSKSVNVAASRKTSSKSVNAAASRKTSSKSVNAPDFLGALDACQRVKCPAEHKAGQVQKLQVAVRMQALVGMMNKKEIDYNRFRQEISKILKEVVSSAATRGLMTCGIRNCGEEIKIMFEGLKKSLPNLCISKKECDEIKALFAKAKTPGEMYGVIMAVANKKAEEM